MTPDQQFLSSLGIVPDRVTAPPVPPHRERQKPVDLDASSWFAGRLFSRPEFSRFFDIAWSNNKCATLRVIRNAQGFDRCGLFPGREIGVILATCWPADGDLILHALDGESRVTTFSRSMRGDHSLCVAVLDLDGHERYGHAIIREIGPNSIPELSVGAEVLVSCGVNGGSFGGRIEGRTSRAYHVRCTTGGRHGLTTITFREIRSGSRSLTPQDVCRERSEG
jgi:hypothetical protein